MERGAMDLRALTWLDPVRIYSGSGIISVNGAQNFGANLGVFQTDANLALNCEFIRDGQSGPFFQTFQRQALAWPVALEYLI